MDRDRASDGVALGDGGVLCVSLGVLNCIVCGMEGASSVVGMWVDGRGREEGGEEVGTVVREEDAERGKWMGAGRSGRGRVVSGDWVGEGERPREGTVS